MGRWTNFIGRKTPLAIVPPSRQEQSSDEALADLQSEITRDQSQLSGLEEEARDAGNQLGEIAQLSSALKIRISERDSAASSALDALEKERTAIERRHEGLNLRIRSLQTLIAPKVRRVAELAEARDQARQDQSVEDLRVQCEALTAELLNHWRAACSTGFDLMNLLDDAMTAHANLDEAHRHLVLALNGDFGAKMLQASLEHVNGAGGGWVFAPRVNGFHALKILPGRPRSAIARTG
jgi:chromosome segregation ATPase